MKKSFATMSKYEYPFYILFHPWDGFQELKYNKKGSVMFATILLFLWYVSQVFARQSTDFVFNPNRPEMLDLFKIALSTMALFLIAVLSNWCFSTFMDGKGTLSDIFTVGSYCLIPIIGATFINTILSKFFVLPEVSFMTTIKLAGTLWSLFLLFAAVQQTHDLEMSGVLMMLGLTIVGMLGILFLMMLVYSLFQQVVMFVVNISYEILYRITI